MKLPKKPWVDPTVRPQAPQRGGETANPGPVPDPTLEPSGWSSDGAPDDPGWTEELQARVGRPGVSGLELTGWPSGFVLRHLSVVMAAPAQGTEREQRVDGLARELLRTQDPAKVRRWLVDLPREAPIVNLYPLEVRARIMELDPSFWPEARFAPLFRNGPDLDRSFQPGELIRLRHPVGLVLQSFALEGGGHPEYVLAPGPPGNYGLEWGAPGDFAALFQGEFRGEVWVERRRFAVRDAPSPPSGW